MIIKIDDKYRILRLDPMNWSYEEWKEVENKDTKEKSWKWVRRQAFYVSSWEQVVDRVVDMNLYENEEELSMADFKMYVLMKLEALKNQIRIEIKKTEEI